MHTLLRILAVLLLVLANGFFVTSEFAIVSVRRMRIAALAETGNKRARRLLAFKDNLGAYISATQLGVTLSSLGLGWLGESTLADLLAPQFDRLATLFPAPYGDYLSVGVRLALAGVVAFVLITFFHIVFGEQVPKMLGIERSQRVVTKVSALGLERSSSSTPVGVNPSGMASTRSTLRALPQPAFTTWKW